MNAASLKKALRSICALIGENKEYLVELDAQNGDGDLGISMHSGYSAVVEFLDESTETDLGRLLMGAGKTFNTFAPSSLGTITSFGMMGMAKVLKGKTEADLADIAQAMAAGVALIMEKAGSKPGEKTILDALSPAVQSLEDNQDKTAKAAFGEAARAAAEGSESTRDMKSVHGRAAYYGEKSIGVLDGGSVVGRLIFEGIEKSL